MMWQNLQQTQIRSGTGSSFPYYNCCVTWPPADVLADGGLVDMIDNARQVSRRTFLTRVDKEDLQNLEIDLGYSLTKRHGMTMADDRYVTYFKGKLHGRTAYYFVHSAIEYVFCRN